MLQNKRIYMYIFLIFTILSIQSTFASSNIPLKKGMTCDMVSQLQEKLKTIGIINIDPTGYFGDITETAVIKFQKKYNLDTDGIVGTQTLSMIDSIIHSNESKITITTISTNSILKKGMNSEYVVELQNDLKKLDLFNLDPTGYFGDITEAAVKKFQKDHGLSVDGNVGTATYSKINILLSKPDLKKGMSNKDITELQSNLKKLQFFNQEPTGYFGDITEASVKNFQKQYNLKVSGVMDLLTYVKIDSALNKYNGIKVVIDPGHGGIDEGTSRGNVIESEITLDISKKLKSYLDEDGYTIDLTRNKDIALDSLSNISGTREMKDLDARTNIINKSQANCFVSIHVNSYPESPSSSGSIVFYNNKLPESKILAQNIQKALNNITVSGFKRQSNNCQTANFYILRSSNIPGVLVETAYVTNTNELKLLTIDSFRDKIARAIASGIENTKLK